MTLASKNIPSLSIIAICALMMTTPTVRADHLTAEVTGSLADGSTFVGTLRVTSFRSRLDDLFARGQLIGTFIDSQDRVTHVISQRVTLPILNVQASSDSSFGQGCDFLIVETGQLNLELLDRIVELDPVVIEIESDPSLGLIGTDLCDIAQGFDDGLARQAARDLNDIIEALEDLDDFRRF